MSAPRRRAAAGPDTCSWRRRAAASSRPGSLFEFAHPVRHGVLLARALGAGDYGLYVLAISAATLFAGIALLGLDDAMMRYVAILSGRRDDAGVRGTIQLGLGVAAAVGAAVGAVLYLAAEPVADGPLRRAQLAQLLQLVSVMVPFLAVSNALAASARGFRRMDVVGAGGERRPVDGTAGPARRASSGGRPDRARGAV